MTVPTLLKHGTLNLLDGYDSFVPLAVGETALAKVDPSSVAFTVTGTGTISVKAGTVAYTPGGLATFQAATAVSMPTLVPGTNYSIFATAPSSATAVAAGTAGPTGSLLIGGFHYAPGGNATGVAGGNTTPAINPYSCWDLKWRPACQNPLGMALVAGAFWADIYLCGTNVDVNGTSFYGATMADGTSPPLVPASFGGGGGVTYPDFGYWSAAELIGSAGKRLPSVREFGMLAYGITEKTSLGADPETAGLDAPRTSKWGVMQAAGVMWIWGEQFGGPYAAASWSTAGTNGRGQVYNMPNAALLGGNWNDGSDAGSRCSAWNDGPSISANSIGGRGACDHLVLV